MSDEGEKTCPLCAEEMDLTDQQLKPCRCGYEVCVWCWHHIMEMAEKDETEGRCPACRTPYDKEKTVGTASKCDRLAAEISMEKKKSQKSKTKTSEGRKQLSSVRVIQRNLVYIVGLPLELADEDLLLHKEYFGQYGKVLKVSISRTSAGTIQQFANNTCSVYITYSKEEEAVRCIQSIHGFTLDGRSLRACFGTTKYCHAWLRSVPCTNADCLYLHEIGSHEDSFSKDEIISSYSRVQQITGIANSGQRRSGNVLPPPADDYCNNSSTTPGKPVVKSTPINLGSSARVSPPTSSAGRTGALPAAASWGSRGSTFQTSTGGMVCSNGPVKQKSDAASASLTSSPPVAAVMQTSAQSTVLGKKVVLNDDIHPKEPKNKVKPPENKKQVTKDLNSNSSEDSYTPLVAHAAPMEAGRQPSVPVIMDINKKSFVEEQSNVTGTENNERVLATGEKNQKLCPDVTSTSVDKQFSSQNSAVARPNGLSLDCFLVRREQAFQHSSDAKLPYLALAASKAPTSLDGASLLRSDLQSPALPPLSEKEDDFEMQRLPYLAPAASKAPTSLDGASLLRSDLQSPALPPLSEKEDNFEMQRLSDAIVTQTSLTSSSHSFNLFHHSRGPLHQHSDGAAAVRRNVNPVVNKQDVEHLAAIASNGLVHNQLQSTSGNGHSYVLPNGIHETRMGNSDYGVDGMESSIISNILSLDLDAWDDSLTSPQDFVKLLGENERHQGTFNTSNSWKAQNNQSRFSFARQEESRTHSFDVEPSYNSGINSHSFSHREPFMDKLGNGYGLPQHHAEQYDSFGSNQSVSSTIKLSVSRAQTSAPPGFSVPSRLPPPGFSSHGRTDQTFDMKSGNHFLERASTFRDPYQASPSVNSGSIVDIDFIDPAILAVGKGRPPSSLGNSNIDMGPTFSSQTSAFESDSRLQLLKQRSLQPQQNFRYADIGKNYSPSDAYGFSSRHMEPSQIGGLSSFSQFAHQPRNGLSNNSHWDSWPEVMSGNNMGTAELLRNGRLNFNKLYGGYEEPKFQMPGSGDLYNKTFGM